MGSNQISAYTKGTTAGSLEGGDNTFGNDIMFGSWWLAYWGRDAEHSAKTPWLRAVWREGTSVIATPVHLGRMYKRSVHRLTSWFPREGFRKGERDHCDVIRDFVRCGRLLIVEAFLDLFGNNGRFARYFGRSGIQCAITPCCSRCN